MTTDTLNAILGASAPLVVVLIGAAVAYLRAWSTSQTKTANKSALMVACENAVKAYVHTHLAQGQLLDYTQHGAAIVSAIGEVEPGWPKETVSTIVQAVMHDANTAILQTTAQQQQAAAATPTVIQPDPVEVARAMIQALMPQALPAADPAPTPGPATLAPATLAPATVTASGAVATSGLPVSG